MFLGGRGMGRGKGEQGTTQCGSTGGYKKHCGHEQGLQLKKTCWGFPGGQRGNRCRSGSRRSALGALPPPLTAVLPMSVKGLVEVYCVQGYACQVMCTCWLLWPPASTAAT